MGGLDSPKQLSLRTFVTDKAPPERPAIIDETQAPAPVSGFCLFLRNRKRNAQKKAQRLAAKLKQRIDEKMPYPSND